MIILLIFIIGCGTGSLDTDNNTSNVNISNNKLNSDSSKEHSGSNQNSSLKRLAFKAEDIINFDYLLPNRIQNGSFELGIGAEPVYFGWKLEKLIK